MKINWNQNPLRTTVDVDENDRERILLYIQNEEYTDILCDLDLWIKGTIRKDVPVTVEKIAEELSEWGQICNMKTDDEQVNMHVAGLQHSHGGDCTCFPATCFKCLAEESLGIDTIRGLGKHSAHKIYMIFNENPDLTLDEAIAKLEEPAEYIKPSTWPDGVGYEHHIPRWKREREAAVKWLKQYREDHFR